MIALIISDCWLQLRGQGGLKRLRLAPLETCKVRYVSGTLVLSVCGLASPVFRINFPFKAKVIKLTAIPTRRAEAYQCLGSSSKTQPSSLKLQHQLSHGTMKKHPARQTCLFVPRQCFQHNPNVLPKQMWKNQDESLRIPTRD